jgi:ACS family allantoate permease-like MFS transporter
MIMLLPWSNKIGLLACVYLTGKHLLSTPRNEPDQLLGVGTSGFVLSLSWLSAVTAGHTKRVTTNAIMLSAYCVGNIVGPQMFQQKYKPRCVFAWSADGELVSSRSCRNIVPWSVIAACYILCPVVLLGIRYMLAKENKKRESETHDSTYDEVFVKEKLDDGTIEIRKVDKV